MKKIFWVKRKIDLEFLYEYSSDTICKFLSDDGVFFILLSLDTLYCCLWFSMHGSAMKNVDLIKKKKKRTTGHQNHWNQHIYIHLNYELNAVCHSSVSLHFLYWNMKCILMSAFVCLLLLSFKIIYIYMYDYIHT